MEKNSLPLFVADTAIGKTPIAVGPPYQLVRARHGWMLVNPNDFYLGAAILQYGEYNELEAAFLAQLMTRPGTVVEVGANIGTHTVGMAKQAAAIGCELVAFEPQPFIFQNLCANMALNGLANVRAWPWACGDETTTLYFPAQDYKAGGNFGGVSMLPRPGAGNVPVPCVRLDDVLDHAGIALMKIDVEGFELPALKGATAILARSRPTLYLENDRVHKSKELIEWLWSQNYRLWWHIPRLFNPDNFFAHKTNIYGNVASFNMLGIPREIDANIIGLTEITDSGHHPLAPSAPLAS